MTQDRFEQDFGREVGLPNEKKTASDDLQKIVTLW